MIGSERNYEIIVIKTKYINGKYSSGYNRISECKIIISFAISSSLLYKLAAKSLKVVSFRLIFNFVRFSTRVCLLKYKRDHPLGSLNNRTSLRTRGLPKENEIERRKKERKRGKDLYRKERKEEGKREIE